MTTKLLAPFLLASTALATPLWADLTADDVWAHWQQSAQGFGASLTSASETRSGATLAVSGLSVAFSDDDFEGSMTLGDVSFVEQGDGTVRVVVPETLPLTLSVTFEGEAAEIGMTVTSTDLDTVVSGDPDNMVSNYTAASLGVSVDEFPDMPPNTDFQLTLAMTGLSGSNATSMGPLIRTQGSYEADTTTYTVSGSDPEGGGLDFGLLVNGLKLVSSGQIPEGVSLMDTTALYGSPDYMQSVSVTTQGGSGTFAVDGPDGAGSGEFSAAAGRTNVAFMDGGFTYDGGATDIALRLEAEDLPLPLSFTMDEYRYAFGMPLIQTDTAEPFAVGLGFKGVEIDAFLWNIFDPGQVLPRTLATANFDITGLGRWFVDILDMDEAMMMAEDVPGEVSQVNLSDLELDVAGARLTGAGSFTLDNADMFTIPGFPRPEGKLDLELVGGNGLLDNLVLMGIVPQDQAMGARMMMGLVAVPGSAPDTLTSTIEVNAEGHVLANGQRLR